MANQKILRYGTAGQWMVVMDGDRGMPEGGFNRQILTKTSGANFETQWRDPSGFTFTQSGAPTVALDGTSALASGETWYDTATGDSYVRVANAWVKFSGGDDEARFMNTTGDTMNGQLIVNGGGGDTMELKPGTANHVYIEFFARTANPASRSGYLGFPAAGSNDFTIANSLPGDIVLAPSTGRVVLNADPTGTLHAATKQYVDAQVATRVPLAGGVMTGILDFSNTLGTKIELYDGYSFGIEGSTIRYTSSAGSGQHAFSGYINATSYIQSASYVRAEGGYVAADTIGYFRNYNKGGHRLMLGPWANDGAWTCMYGNCGYILIDHISTAANMYVRSNGILNLGGASGITFENTVTSSLTVNGPSTSVNSLNSGRSTAVWSGGAYNEANHFSNSPAYGVASNSYHPSGVACQFRMGINVQTLYLMGINGGDNNVTLVSAAFANSSSRMLKQDIVDWPLPKAKALSADVNVLAPSDPIDLLRQVRPVWFRRKRELALAMLPKEERREQALLRLNKFRTNRGMEPFQSEELVHQCGRDCNGSDDTPCETIRNWETGEVGFIAEEMGPILPQVGVLDPFIGGFQGLNLSALASFGIAASKQQQVIIDDLLARVEALEAQLT